MDSKGIRSAKLDLCKKCGKMFPKTRRTNVCPKCLPHEYLPHEYLPKFKIHFESPRTLLTEMGGPIKKVSIGQKDKKWSLKHDHCVICGRNDIKHLARGLCVYCYQQETEKRGRGKQRIVKGLALSKLNYKYLYEKYVSKERSLSDIAKDCDCSRQYVYKRMVEFNIPLRTQKKARELAYDRQKILFTKIDETGKERLVILSSIQINENFFSSWSNEMAYVLGVIFTDGNINPGSKGLSIAQKEPELLNKVLKLMNCDMKLRHSKKRGIAGAVYRFDICREKIYDDLINLGLTPRKSKTMEFPNMPPECVRHFVRGCWDGDGSIFISGGKLKGSYVCGSLKFIERLVQELYKAGIYKTQPPYSGCPLTIQEGKKSNYYTIKIDARTNLEKLFDYFYDRVDESMYLERKFETFAKGLSIITDGFRR